MALTECANGHLYDSTQYASCPYCNGGVNRVEFASPESGIGKTVGASSVVNQSAPNVGEIGATVAPASYQAASKPAEEEDIGKTVAVMKKDMDLEPVVGWIVCIQGAERGKDFKILAKNNTIGRGEGNDIIIKKDSTISRQSHARIAYDVKHNTFHLIPGEGTNGLYLNDDPVYVPTPLNSFDLIEMGESKFLFIPFCGEKFNWQNGLQ